MIDPPPVPQQLGGNALSTFSIELRSFVLFVLGLCLLVMTMLGSLNQGGGDGVLGDSQLPRLVCGKAKCYRITCFFFECQIAFGEK